MRYLIRRRNRYGQFVHVDTVSLPPTEDSIRGTYGYGHYNILTATEGTRGLQPYADFKVMPKVEVIKWYPEMPTKDEMGNLGLGEYFIVEIGKVTPYIVYNKRQENGSTSTLNPPILTAILETFGPPSKSQDEVNYILNQLSESGMALGGYVIFRILEGVPSGKLCPVCNLLNDLENVRCPDCNFDFTQSR